MTKILIGFVLSLFLAVPVIGCSKDSSKKDAGPYDQTGMQPPDVRTDESARQRAREAREAFQRSMNENLRRLERNIADLERAAEGKTGEAYKQSMEELRQARAHLEETYLQAQQASEEAWEDAQRSTQSALDRVERQYNRILEQMKTDSPTPPTNTGG